MYLLKSVEIQRMSPAGGPAIPPPRPPRYTYHRTPRFTAFSGGAPPSLPPSGCSPSHCGDCFRMSHAFSMQMSQDCGSQSLGEAGMAADVSTQTRCGSAIASIHMPKCGLRGPASSGPVARIERASWWSTQRSRSRSPGLADMFGLIWVAPSQPHCTCSAIQCLTIPLPRNDSLRPAGAGSPGPTAAALCFQSA